MVNLTLSEATKSKAAVLRRNFLIRRLWIQEMKKMLISLEIPKTILIFCLVSLHFLIQFILDRRNQSKIEYGPNNIMNICWYRYVKNILPFVKQIKKFIIKTIIVYLCLLFEILHSRSKIFSILLQLRISRWVFYMDGKLFVSPIVISLG